MSTITEATAYLVDLEVETVRTDAVQSFLKQETIFVSLSTTDGLTGLGYSYTIGTGGTAVLALLRDHLLPIATNQSPERLTGPQTPQIPQGGVYGRQCE